MVVAMLTCWCDNAAEMTRLTLLTPATREMLSQAVDTIIERTQDFTDSAYTSHEHRENILLLCDRVKMELEQLLRVGVNLVSGWFNNDFYRWGSELFLGFKSRRSVITKKLFLLAPECHWAKKRFEIKILWISITEEIIELCFYLIYQN